MDVFILSHHGHLDYPSDGQLYIITLPADTTTMEAFILSCLHITLLPADTTTTIKIFLLGCLRHFDSESFPCVTWWPADTTTMEALILGRLGCFDSLYGGQLYITVLPADTTTMEAFIRPPRALRLPIRWPTLYYQLILQAGNSLYSSCWPLHTIRFWISLKIWSEWYIVHPHLVWVTFPVIWLNNKKWL